MRGDFVIAATQGTFGKPRPTLVIQTNVFSEHTKVTVLAVTSTLVDAPLLRITVEPIALNGLKKPSQIMVDKAITIKHDKVGPTFDRIDADAIMQVDRCLRIFLGIAK